MNSEHYLPDAYLNCRTFRHGPFEPFTPSREELPRRISWTRPLGLLCLSCGTKRIDIIGTHGQLVTRKYIYPEDYQLTKETRPTLPNLRLEWLERQHSRRRHPSYGPPTLRRIQ